MRPTIPRQSPPRRKQASPTPHYPATRLRRRWSNAQLFPLARQSPPSNAAEHVPLTQDPPRVFFAPGASRVSPSPRHLPRHWPVPPRGTVREQRLLELRLPATTRQKRSEHAQLETKQLHLLSNNRRPPNLITTCVPASASWAKTKGRARRAIPGKRVTPPNVVEHNDYSNLASFDFMLSISPCFSFVHSIVPQPDHMYISYLLQEPCIFILQFYGYMLGG